MVWIPERTPRGQLPRSETGAWLREQAGFTRAPSGQHVRTRDHVTPAGIGTITWETEWTAIVQFHADGVERLFGKSALSPL